VIGVAVGEMVGGNIGLGYLLVYGEGQADTPMVFVTIIALTLIGILMYVAVVLAERWILNWQPRELVY
jgi:NitT/TauT family transport system permease protein